MTALGPQPVKVLPIPFSAPMVLALLAGTKRQTRCIVKPHFEAHESGRWTFCAASTDAKAEGKLSYSVLDPEGSRYTERGRERVVAELKPYAEPGDRLWVRETWRTAKTFDELSPSEIAAACLKAGYPKPWAPLEFDADKRRRDWEDSFELGKTRVSIHMPRWASRITLEVTGVRVERLQAISEEDAKAEGMTACTYNPEQRLTDGTRIGDAPFRASYAISWDTANGFRNLWKDNPWVWVVSFRPRAGRDV